MPFLTHTQVPYGRLNSRAAGVVSSAFRRRVEVATFHSSLGDVTGFGNVFVACLNRKARKVFGSHPGTSWHQIATSLSDTAPRGQFCSRSGVQGNVADPVGYNGNYAAPGFPIKKIFFNSGSPSPYGAIISLEGAFAGSDPFVANEVGSFMPVDGSVAYNFEWIAHARGQVSSEPALDTQFNWKWTKAPSGSPIGYFYSSVQNRTVNIDTADGFNPNSTTAAAKRMWLPLVSGGADTPVTIDPANQNQYIELTNGSATGYLASAGRFTQANSWGMRFHEFGVGGYHIGSIVGASGGHAGCAPVLQVMGPFDLVIIALQCNSAYAANYDADTYNAKARELVSFIRQTLPAAAIIMVGDHYRQGGTVTQDNNYNQYAGVDYQMFLDGVVDGFINTHRITEDDGFNAFAHDGTGKTWRGSWSSAGVSYVANDVVSVGAASGAQENYLCINPHTSDAGSNPRSLSGNAARNWRRFGFWRAKAVGSGNDPTTSVLPLDVIHWSPYGAERAAEIWLNQLLGQTANNGVFAKSAASVTVAP